MPPFVFLMPRSPNMVPRGACTLAVAMCCCHLSPINCLDGRKVGCEQKSISQEYGKMALAVFGSWAYHLHLHRHKYSYGPATCMQFKKWQSTTSCWAGTRRGTKTDDSVCKASCRYFGLKQYCQARYYYLFFFRLEKNRQAAKESRKRKKQHIGKLFRVGLIRNDRVDCCRGPSTKCCCFT